MESRGAGLGLILPMNKAALSTAISFALLTHVASGQIGSGYCYGTTCPCANDDATAGCGNSGVDGDVATGALLTASGSADVFADDLLLSVGGIDSQGFGMFLMGVSGPAVSVGDGLLCLGTTGSRTWRFPAAKADAAGQLGLTSIITYSQGFNGGGEILAGSTFGFQLWYRDPNGPCATSSNFSNALDVTFMAPGTSGPIATDLAGNKLSVYPHFEYINTINEGARVRACVDSTLYPWLIGTGVDIYVTASQDPLTWDANPALTDVRGAPQTVSIQAGGPSINTFVLSKGLLNGTSGMDLGVGYDVVVDVDQNGILGAGDLIDGYSADAGVYIVRDLASPGPHSVVEALYDGGTWLREVIYYPANIATLGPRPLIVVSHGNGHNYKWYDHIGNHMASYGYVVMSHSNNTGPGIETASTTTLDNTDHFLGNLATIAGGALSGLVDSTQIVWLGHSRGAEGVVRAYDRVFDSQYVPTHFTLADIKLVSSIAPTTFLDGSKVQPHSVPFHLWVGSADADVAGAPGSGHEPFSILERAEGDKMSITVQGAGHAVFHNGGGNWWASGPCQNSPSKVHPLMFGYFLPLVDHTLTGNPAGREFLWRHYEAFQPIGAPPNGNGCVVVNLELQETIDAAVFVIDDFQKKPSPRKSSSGGLVSMSVTDVDEGQLDDSNSKLDWIPSDPFNGMTRNEKNTNEQKGLVFSFDGVDSFIEWAISPSQTDFADDTTLSFRACQGARHPLTVAALEPLTFDVSLRDDKGVTCSISIGAYGGGISEPYQRGGLGAGAGWSNEFETIRIRLRDFVAGGSGLNLARIEAVRFDFGPSHGSNEGRVGLDDLEVIQ